MIDKMDVVSADMSVLGTSESRHWTRCIQSMRHDIYHKPDYHRLSEDNDKTAYLFHYREGAFSIAVPLLLRRIEDVTYPCEWLDATSVYGYAGPIASHASLPRPVIDGFHSALQQALRERNVISVFSRLHPFIDQRPLLQGLGECQTIGKTVFIDLQAPSSEQWRVYRANHKRDIKRLKRLGAVVIKDNDSRFLDEFLRFYEDTMRRNNASSYYFFGSLFFSELLSRPQLGNHLFVCLIDQVPACAGIFSSCNGIVQYHYSGTCERWCRLSPLKLLIDEVRKWSQQQGARCLHLGGGVGAREDSLFSFKLGFSPHRHPFSVWRWVTQPPVYKMLCGERVKQREHKSQPTTDYFPAYRAPAS